MSSCIFRYFVYIFWIFATKILCSVLVIELGRFFFFFEAPGGLERHIWKKKIFLHGLVLFMKNICLMTFCRHQHHQQEFFSDRWFRTAKCWQGLWWIINAFSSNKLFSSQSFRMCVMGYLATEEHCSRGNDVQFPQDF